MTSLQIVTRAALYFEKGGFAYHFDVPEKNKNMTSYVARIRKHALKFGYSWRVVHNIGRAWIIKQRTAV